jgi:hypothetical protein
MVGAGKRRPEHVSAHDRKIFAPGLQDDHRMFAAAAVAYAISAVTTSMATFIGTSVRFRPTNIIL